MAKSNPINDGLAKIATIQHAPTSQKGEQILRDSLARGAGLVVAKATRIIAEVACGPEHDDPSTTPLREEILEEAWTRSFLPKLTDAFDRLLANPKKDNGTPGKQALLRALNRMSSDDPHPFLSGSSCIQLEPQMFGPVDTAPPVRAESIMGLVRLRHPKRFTIMTDLLWDNYQDARLGAVRAALYDDSETAEILLRAKTFGGDKGDDIPARPPDGGATVLGEIFYGLLARGKDAYIPFVTKFLHDTNQTPQVLDQAAMALGDCRLPAALNILINQWESSPTADERERIFFAVALNGTDTAMETLARWMDEAPGKVAASYKRILHSIYDPTNPRLAKILPP